jgi:glycosyltransferase involved in cell wall biosynthesis
MHQALLTIAIPTYCRSQYLGLCLEQFLADKALFSDGRVELLILDNCSPDETPAVVCRYQQAGLVLRYIRHQENIGSDANFAQCFNLASGRYVQLLGDDDLYLPGMLARLLSDLSEGDYGVVILKSYGYECDFKREHPGGAGQRKEFVQPDAYLYEVGQLITFISACVINKQVQLEVDARDYCGSNLVQVHLVLLAILRTQSNLYLTDYYLACKRANSGGYDFSEVFVERLFNIARRYRNAGLSDVAIDALARKMLYAYYPFSLLRVRLENKADLEAMKRRFRAEFGSRPAYLFWNAPILSFPRPFAIMWALVAVFVGRIANGDLRRGIHFAFNRFRSRGGGGS